MFDKKYCATITDWVKANYLVGGPSRDSSEFNMTFKLAENGIDIDNYKINQSNSSFKEMVVNVGDKLLHPGYYSTGSVVDYSKVRFVNRVQFAFTKLKTIKNFTCQDNASLMNVFYTNNDLTEIINYKPINAKLTVSVSPNLKTLTFGSNCTFISVDVSPCTNLTKESLINLLNALQTLENETRQCVIGTDNIAKLNDEEIAIATKKGWTLS